MGWGDMKVYLWAALAAASFATVAYAADTIETYPARSVIEDPQYASKLEGVEFYFGNTAPPQVIRSFGEVRANKKTNGFAKGDATSCRRAMADALIVLAKEARARGGDAVIKIKSNFKNHQTVSDTDFTCGAGNLMSGVALIGEVVKTR
jgi:uncharacterized protein YbjQ (UPF0145 family)